MGCREESEFLLTLLCFPQRPYDIHSNNPVESLVQLFSTVSVQYSSTWSKEMVALLRKVRALRVRVLRVGRDL